jgi:tetratricopeptide (TPR) repeat protein
LGESCGQEDQLELAIAYFTKAIKADPNPLTHYFVRRASAYSTVKDYKRALLDADRIVATGSGGAWPYQFRAQINVSAKRYREAVADCTQSLRLKPGEMAVYQIRAKAYDALGEKALADGDRKRLNELAKDSF